MSSSESYSRLSVEPAKLSFVLRGSAKSLESAEAKDIVLYAEISDLPDGIHEIPLKTILPEETSPKETLPPVKVTVQHKSA